MMRLFFIATAAVALIACNDRTRAVSPTSPGNGQPDLGVVADAAFDNPVRGLCVPGSQRCVAENSPLLDVCDDEGRSYHREVCDEGDICREGACVPFACVPNRKVCIGASQSATCAASGAAIEDPVACDGAEVCLGGECIDPCRAAEDARSYITCDYTAVDLENYYRKIPADTPAPFAIVVANPAPLVTTSVTVTTGTGEVASLRGELTLDPGGTYALGRVTDLRSEVLARDGAATPIETPESVELGPGDAAVFLLNEADKYRVSASRPVVAYQFSPYCCNFTATNDASLLLPSSSWGTRYRVVNYPAWRQGDNRPWERPYVTLVADSDAVVTVTSPVDVVDPETGNAGRELTVSLTADKPVSIATNVSDDVSGYVPEGDLTGMLVESDVPIGVFTGHPCTFVPTDQWACDHLQEALLPAEILGSSYILTPMRQRNDLTPAERERDELREATYWRIVADESTTLTFAPPLDEVETLAPSNETTPTCTDGLPLEPGEFCEIGLNRPVVLNGSGATIVAGIISGHQSTGVAAYGTQAGDPSMFILPPVDQFRNTYAFVSPPTFKRTYVAVAAPTSVPILLDGRSVPAENRLERRVVTLSGREYEVFSVALEPGVHRMESELRFGIVAYAYDDYVSYAFTGGLDLVPKRAPAANQ